MLADDFAEDGTIIDAAFQVAAAHLEHGAITSGLPRDVFSRRTAEYTGRIAGSVPFHTAACDPHEAGLSVISSEIRILARGAAELGQRHDNCVVPGRTVRIE